MIAATIANGRPGKRVWQPGDFVQQWDAEPEPPQTEAEMQVQFDRLLSFERLLIGQD